MFQLTIVNKQNTSTEYRVNLAEVYLARLKTCTWI